MKLREKIKKVFDLSLRLWKTIDKDDVLNPVEQLAFDIFKICLESDKNIRFLSSDYSSKRYIVAKTYITKNEAKTFIILSATPGSLITIVNHQYKYDISLPMKTYDIMCRMFDKKVEQERTKMENEILSNITDSLEVVLMKFKSNLE